MTTTSTTPPHPALVALPAKAVRTDEWEPDDDDGRYYRYFAGEDRQVVACTKYGKDLAVCASGFQHDDGSIADGSDEFYSAPDISICTFDVEDGGQTETGISLTGEAARRLADVLVTAADELDGWSAR
ncbi:MAG: hypothetical protein QOJ24_4211 [Mycobacterium sp.]|jgi:hypothetical protein|nr:hypothetical protein [Mycobacterium sp.]